MEEPKKRLEDVIPNEYEAVLLAAKLARKINSRRVVEKENTPAEELGKLDQRKVTSVALDELISGKVKYERKAEPEEEESFDLT
jgi:DNA-directed RNA polymerase omega subunit